ncbi:hypothetical protein [Methylobacter sp. BlB1]|uniref:hypothetical protein n=1 Tax=Methylobacter sp. BlB1 TaxID=2785914 RepID=UPI001E3D205F|nr:hypothetical protein [Methylobacter sp. BlB1]
MTGNNGPLGGSTNRPVIDEGTLIQHRSPSPGPIGIAAQNSSHVTSENESRGLTVGEIQMAKKIFKDSINYARVRVHNEGYFPFGLQNARTAVTPDGEMYFLPSDFREDFSTSTVYEKAWFIHEMTHVWQYQLGYWVMFRGAFRPGLDYKYTLDAQRKFCDYNMEAQGDILADYFALKFLKKPDVVRNKLSANPPATYSLEDYETTLKDFLTDPSNSDNLP